MKLTQIEIKFIDTYLKNSEIEFLDVRLEMIDHVASQVEHKMDTEHLDFYHAFKNYLVLHKKEHQKANKKFVKITDKKILKEIILFYSKPLTILSVVTLFIILKVISINFGLNYILKFAPIVGMFALVTYYFGIRQFLGRKERYSAIERLSFPLLAFMQIHQLLLNSFFYKAVFDINSNLNIALISFHCTVVHLFIVLINKYNIKYTTLYKKI
jgi:hypothetical protein